LPITQEFQTRFTVLALLADFDVLFILRFAFRAVDVTQRASFAALINFIREKNDYDCPS